MSYGTKGLQNDCRCITCVCLFTEDERLFYNSENVQRNFVDKGLEAPCHEKSPEKSALEPTPQNRPADQNHCPFSTQLNPHLRK